MTAPSAGCCRGAAQPSERRRQHPWSRALEGCDVACLLLILNGQFVRGDLKQIAATLNKSLKSYAPGASS